MVIDEVSSSEHCVLTVSDPRAPFPGALLPGFLSSDPQTVAAEQP